MEYQVRGFASMSEYVNVTRAIYPVGELEDYCRTFSTVEEEFVLGNSNPYYGDASGVTETSFIKFACRNAQDKEVPLNGSRHSFYTDAVSALIRYINDFTNVDTAANQLTTLLANANGTLDSTFVSAFSNVQANGAHIVTANPVRHLPPSVTFTFTNGNDIYHTKIWFSNSLMKDEYDLYEIRVAPPVKLAQLSDLAGTYNTVQNMVNNYPYAERLNDNILVRNGDPETATKPLTMQWVDQNNPTATLDLDWTIIGYGPMSSDATNIVKALKEYLVANSSIPLETWLEIFPYLQSKNEFLFFPFFDQKAVHAQGANVSAYNPVVNYNKISQVLNKVFVANYQGQLSYTEVGSVVHKSLGYLVIGNEDNMKNNHNFSETYPDYANIRINDPNLNLLSAKTQTLIRVLEGLMVAAENNTPSAVPNMNNITLEHYLGSIRVVKTTIDTTIIRVALKEEVERLLPPQ